MSLKKREELLTQSQIARNIVGIRGQQVLLDFDLALMYGVETRTLKQQVKRNLDRFPDDFMFEVSKEEWQELITNRDNLGNRKFSPALPYAFTEQGVAMLSSVIRSNKAVKVNIAIMRTFVQVRKIFETNKDLAKQIKALEKRYDQQFKVVFDAINQLIRQETDSKRQLTTKKKN